MKISIEIHGPSDVHEIINAMEKAAIEILMSNRKIKVLEVGEKLKLEKIVTTPTPGKEIKYTINIFKHH